MDAQKIAEDIIDLTSYMQADLCIHVNSLTADNLLKLGTCLDPNTREIVIGWINNKPVVLNNDMEDGKFEIRPRSSSKHS